jgi:hypothetical protein
VFDFIIHVIWNAFVGTVLAVAAILFVALVIAIIMVCSAFSYGIIHI